MSAIENLIEVCEKLIRKKANFADLKKALKEAKILLAEQSAK